MLPESLGCQSGLVAQPTRPCLSSLPTEGIPGSAQQVIQVDRDTVLVSFEREYPRVRVVGQWRVAVKKALWVSRPLALFLCAGCVRIVNLQGEPTAALAPELTFDFPIETVGE